MLLSSSGERAAQDAMSQADFASITGFRVAAAPTLGNASVPGCQRIRVVTGFQQIRPNLQRCHEEVFVGVLAGSAHGGTDSAGSLRWVSILLRW